MTLLFIILILILVLLMGLFILIQNPKGGGMDSAIMGGAGNQIFGVKQSTNILEKGTWILATAILILCITAPIFISKTGTNSNNINKEEELLQKLKP